MKTILQVFLALVAAGCCFGFGFAFNDIQDGQPVSQAPFGRLLGLHVDMTPPEVYEANFHTIQNNYTRNLAGTDLRYAAMEGLVATLGDPHTDYFEPVAAERFSTENHGEFVGVGARLGDSPLGAKVAAVFEGGPASKSGLKVNDTIIAVDGAKTAGMPVTDIVGLIRGQEGTTVHLDILRADSSAAVKLAMVRAKVEIPSAEGKILPGNIGYISVAQFTETSPEQFKKALDTMVNAHTGGLIIDMRDDPGGLLNAASEMLGNFVSNKLVVSMRLRNGDVKEEKTPSGQTVDFPHPVVILIDENSASAAEIFSGVLRDYKIATLVGEHSYGKTSVQNVRNIEEDNASVKVTIAKYFLPSGTNFDRKVDIDGTYISGGLKPDFNIEMPTGEQVVAGDPEKDPQLKKAIEVVNQLKAQGK